MKQRRWGWDRKRAEVILIFRILFLEASRFEKAIKGLGKIEIMVL